MSKIAQTSTSRKLADALRAQAASLLALADTLVIDASPDADSPDGWILLASCGGPSLREKNAAARAGFIVGARKIGKRWYVRPEAFDRWMSGSGQSPTPANDVEVSAESYLRSWAAKGARS